MGTEPSASLTHSNVWVAKEPAPPAAICSSVLQAASQSNFAMSIVAAPMCGQLTCLLAATGQLLRGTGTTEGLDQNSDLASSFSELECGKTWALLASPAACMRLCDAPEREQCEGFRL